MSAKRSKKKARKRKPLPSEPEPSAGELRRAEIVGAAVKCLARNGIEGTSYESVGKLLGIRRSHINYYFKSRDQILRTCIEYVMSTATRIADKRIRAESSGSDQLKQYIDATFEWTGQNRDHAVVYLLYCYSSAYRKEFRKGYRQVRKIGLTRVRAMLKKAKLSETDKLAQVIIQLLTGAVLESLSHPSSEYKKVLASQKRLVTKVILEITG